MYHHVSPCIAMYYHVLPCIAMYCHVLPCITMFYHVLPCIATYCHVCTHRSRVTPLLLGSLLLCFFFKHLERSVAIYSVLQHLLFVETAESHYRYFWNITDCKINLEVWNCMTDKLKIILILITVLPKVLL